MMTTERTAADVQAEITRELKALHGLGLAKLVSLFEEMKRRADAHGLGTKRWPIAFVEDGDRRFEHRAFAIDRRPQVPIRPMHLVCDSATAKSYRLIDVLVGRCSQMIDASPLPLSIFDAAHVQRFESIAQNGDLSSVMEWKTDAIVPGLSLSLAVERIVPDPPPFAAIFWCAIDWP